MKIVNITRAIKPNTILVKKAFNLTVYAGQYYCVSNKKGVKINEIMLRGGGAKIRSPNQGSHSILK